jgi:AcrR family transcriptional regulator
MRSMRPGREGILEAARDLYIESGFRAFTMRDVASRCGISATAIYHHFPDREELIRQVLRIGFERFREYLERGAELTDPRERLLAIAAGYIDFALDYPSDYEAMFGRSDVLPKNAYPKGLNQQKGKYTTFRRLVTIVDQYQQTGAIRGADPEAIALFLWSTLHGLVMLYLSQHIDLRPKKFREVSLNQARLIVDQLMQPRDDDRHKRGGRK